MFKRIDHIEIVPKDPEATINFYVEILGFKLKSRTTVNLEPMTEVIFLELGDTRIEVIAVKAPQPTVDAPWRVGYRAIALEVEDMAQAVAHLKSHNVAFAVDPLDVGGSLRGEIHDPDGLIIELRQWM
ncbi:glyoxylase I family protein [Ferrimonas sediminum]|uniref:Glyoxylase I family protein n=1 Tax=Ferrimonas sediminum TaxID=718193 RepID=A0A1G8R1J0_9GAMM|nr:VOC family protein [Ferrimonas sediminum]SDJ10842.1 glyoxylase I family protein [Ferrimonas sediminum]